MAYALSTTKRKFTRILDSISNSSLSSPGLKPNHENASTSTLPPTFETPTKKPRLARPQSLYVSSAAQISARDLRIRKVTTSGSSPYHDGKSKIPNFTPWDRGQFLERLKTFRHIDKWRTKPEAVNEVQWAKRGWRCVGRERVGCSSCSREVVIQLESDSALTVESNEDDILEAEEWRKSAQEQLVQKYTEMIVSEHDEGCLWRMKGCDATIQRLPLVHPRQALEALRLRYESLVKMSSELPTNLVTPGDFDVKTLCRELAFTLINSSASDPSSVSLVGKDVNEQALSLAMFGWQAEPEHIAGLATCDACYRRLGLWLFRPRSRPNGENEEAVMSRLDIAGEHRDYCPWTNASAQSGGRKQVKEEALLPEAAGWEMLVQVVQNVQHTRRELMPPPPRPSDMNQSDAASVAVSITSSNAEKEDKAIRDAKDKERWAKIKRLKQVFHVKRVKVEDKGNINRPKTTK